MDRFDWRRHEPRPGDLPGRLREKWPEQATGELMDRYREALGDQSPWLNLVEGLAAVRLEGQALREACWRLFDGFLAAMSNPGVIIRRPGKCVFTSHQRADTARGCRVACLADDQALDYWLDVHNPTLGFANNLPANDPRRSILIAAIIEIGLLNSTHVIALHTANSLGSRWVPYELGRAKAKNLTSLQCAGWFEKGQTPSTCGDYVQLAVMTHDEPEVAQWLQKASGHVSSLVSTDCHTHGTVVLQ